MPQDSSASQPPPQSTGAPVPWWATQQEPQKPPRRPLGSIVAIALIAGLVGSAAGNLSTGGSFFGHKVNLVSVSNTIERAPDSVAGIAKRVLPSVVSISTESANGGGTGSGFIIDSNGYILTNNHVVADAVSGGRIRVSLNDGRTIGAKIIGRDSSYDLAVLKIAATNLPALQFGDSDKIQVGDTVIAIGSPLGLAGTVTSGIISAKDRAVTAGGTEGENSFINALQTDAAINPGNSGGPLVDATGAVIGVNSAIASLGASYGSQSGSIGLGFAIPINQARKTANQLIKTGKSTYPIIGIAIDTSYTGIGTKIAESTTAITKGGPADIGGLKAGDIITNFNGKAISNSDELIVAVRAKSVGDKVSLEFERNGKSLQTEVTLVAASQ
ncbi:MAG: trypsin-like peptidase domain-containing protein [Actinobacteria bacterium]|nr:trypsin-like peptidase domain-containing protein [Actinomycetota bacterium]